MVKIFAPFLVRGAWSWQRFTASTSNVQAACHAYALTIGATSWDPSQASMMIGGTVVRGHPTHFA